MTFEFTPHPTAFPKEGDTYHYVQTFAGKTTIEHVKVQTVTLKKISCLRVQKETNYRQISFNREVNKDGSHTVFLCRPFVQNGRGFPESKKKEALAEFYRRGGKDA